MNKLTSKQTPSLTDRRASRFRWVIVGLAFVVTLINYLDRSAISYTVEVLKHEFNVTDDQFGTILSAFGLGYILMTVVGGVLVDRKGARIVWSGAAMAWSICTALLGMATGMTMLFSLRMLLGIAEGPSFPSLNRVIADWLPADERARSTAFSLAAVPLASVIGGPLISNLIVHFGWRAMFFTLSALGILWSFIWLWLFRDDPSQCGNVNQAELVLIQSQSLHASITSHNDKKKSSIRDLLANKTLMSNNLAFFAFGYLLFFAVNWLPGYLLQTYSLPLTEVGNLVVAPWLTAGVLIPIGGIISDWLWKKTGKIRTARSHLIWVCQLLSAICFVPLLFPCPLPSALLWNSLGLGLGLMPNSAFYSLCTDVTKERAATAIGIMCSCSAIAAVIAPKITGHIADRTHSFQLAFGILIALTLVSVASVVLFQHPDRIKREETQI